MIAGDTKLIEIDSLPGSNVFRSSIFLGYFGLIIYSLWEGEENLGEWRSALIMLCIFGMLFIAASLTSYFHCSGQQLSKIDHLMVILLPKFFISISTLLFFSVICLLVLIFGGITNSPYAGLLTISPLLLLVEFFSGTDTHVYYQISHIIYKGKNVDINNVRLRISLFVKFVSIILYITAFLPVLTIVIMETLGLYKMFLTDDVTLDQIRTSNWYYWTYFSVFLSAFIAASISVMPPVIFKKLVSWCDQILVSGRR